MLMLHCSAAWNIVCRKQSKLHPRRYERERTMTARRWQDAANLVLGIWLFASPWVLAYDGTAAWNAYVLGAGIVVFALIASYMPKAWEEIINIVLGVWLVVSPFVMGFSAATEV